MIHPIFIPKQEKAKAQSLSLLSNLKKKKSPVSQVMQPKQRGA